ncbi:sulfotransferase [Puniceibacterium confluentis]|uniref:sulfotransferase n=1 Tax=Puniceibacterium confluentis TaxID=1958944 RepID=UPI0011B6E07B|nr:sulfotransferase [Puniceibacterium confluentis]
MLIICNGMPRSGSTLIYNLVRLYLEQTGGTRSMGFFDGADLTRNGPQFSEASTSDEACILKTHYAFDRDALPDAGKVLEIYTIRDPRSMGASMMRIWQFTEDRVLTMLRIHMVTANAYKARSDVIFLRYEDLEERRPELFRAVSAFVVRPYSEEAMLAAVAGVDTIRDQSEQDSMRSVKAFLSRSFLAVNRWLRAGRLLKRLMPDRAVAELKNRLLFINKETMLHPGHVGKLTPQDEVRAVKRAVEVTFEDWMAENGYRADVR